MATYGECGLKNNIWSYEMPVLYEHLTIYMCAQVDAEVIVEFGSLCTKHRSQLAFKICVHHYRKGFPSGRTKVIRGILEPIQRCIRIRLFTRCRDEEGPPDQRGGEHTKANLRDS